MASHDLFWAAVAAAAPIIALANQVTIADSLGVSSFFENARDSSSSGEIHFAGKVGYNATNIAGTLSVSNMFMQALGLLVALQNLLYGHSFFTASAVIGLEFVGLLVIVVTSMCVAIIRAQRNRLEKEGWQMKPKR